MEQEEIQETTQREERIRKRRPRRFLRRAVFVLGLILAVVVIVQVINAAKYRMVVNVVDGENVMGVNPTTEKLDFGDLSKNNGMTRYVGLTNGGKLPIFVAAFQFGEMAQLIKINNNYFVLEPGGDFKLAYELQVPPSAETRKYTGWTIVFRIPKVW